MTIERESRRSDVYLGDGRNTLLPFGFKVFLPTEIAVVLNENGVERTLSHEHGCTVSLNAEQDVQPGGTVRLDAPLPSGSKAVVLSNVRPLQQVDLTNQGGFYPDVLNAVHDRLTMLIQQLMELQTRTPQVPATDNVTGKELAQQIVELSRSLPGIWQLLTSDEMVRLLAILEQNPQLRPTELSSEVNSGREDVAATSKAVKTTYDKAVAAESAAANAEQQATAANELAEGKADATHTHTHAQISDWDSALAQSVSQALADTFTAQKAANGYLKMADGVMFQWIKLEKTINTVRGTYNFPVAFPTACTMITANAMLDNPAVGFGQVIRAKPASASTFDLYVDLWATAGYTSAAVIYVFAIGY